VEVVRDGLGEGFDFSVTVEGEDRGPGLGLVVDRGACVVVRRCSVVVGVTVLPGVVTVSEDAVVVVVVVVV
jgi:acetyltransferase-like isoleucine patch superfamily enzyme